MKQVIQDLRTGELHLEDVPAPMLRTGGILVKNTASLISAGTERSTVSTARQGLVGRAMSRPDLVRQVLDHITRQGLAATVQKIRTRLNAPKAMGYSCAGVVIGVGEGVTEFQVGERVACGGTGYANHAEVVFVPKNLAVPVPTGVDDESAAFATVGAIALHACRQAELTIGESVAVVGLGLVGQLTVQILKAMGCRVIGLDLDESMVKLAVDAGADLGVVSPSDHSRATAARFTAGRGVDAVIVTATSDTNDPIETAAALARDRGRIVIVGAVRMDLPRKPCYEKELQVRFARSYGPGRYDPAYEERGEDYPYGYVRWTEKRNMEEFLRLVSDGAVRPQRLITHRFPLGEAARAYQVLIEPSPSRPVGILFTYPEALPQPLLRIGDSKRTGRGTTGVVGLGVVGAGHFAQDVLLPVIVKHSNVDLVGVCNRTGITAKRVAERFRFTYSTSDPDEIFRDERVRAVVIATRHDLHAPLAMRALRAGKAVFVEKPLALNADELHATIRTLEDTGGLLTVGFNRRFSQYTDTVKTFFGPSHGPMVITYRVNAGPLPPDHWIHDAKEGGGRIISEACHFIDLLQCVTGAAPLQVYARTIGGADPGMTRDDTVTIVIRFSDGSVGTIHYIATGDSTFPKERIEVFADESIAVIEDFKSCTLVRGGRRRRSSGLVQDKGYRGEVEAFLGAIQGDGPAPIPYRELAITTDCALKAVESLRTGGPVELSYR